MQFFWKHLHNNKGDENVSKLIWIVIAFVIGALLLSTMSVAFRTEGAIGGWLDSSLEEWFGEADGRDGSVGGGTGGSGGGLPGGNPGESGGNEATSLEGIILVHNGSSFTSDSSVTSANGITGSGMNYSTLFTQSNLSTLVADGYLSTNGSANNGDYITGETKVVDAASANAVLGSEYFADGTYVIETQNKDSQWIRIGVDESGNVIIPAISKDPSVGGCLMFSARPDSSSDEEGEIIPEGAVYYVGVTETELNPDGYADSCDKVLAAGCEFPETVSIGDVYVYEDYEYRYGYAWMQDEEVWVLASEYEEFYNDNFSTDITVANNWGVKVTDIEKTYYSNMLSEICNKPVTTLIATYVFCENLNVPPVLSENAINIDFAFACCASLTESSEIPEKVTSMAFSFISCSMLKETPYIPDGVVNMEETFTGCASLEKVTNFPINLKELRNTFVDCESLVDVPSLYNCVYIEELYNTFENCSSLISAPKLPQNVKILNDTFMGCEKLENAPLIPTSVTDMQGTFYNCLLLAKAPEIPSGVTILENTFFGCESLTEVPAIPETIVNMNQTFAGCKNLTGQINILAKNVSNCGRCFFLTVLPITINVPAESLTYTSFSTMSEFPSNVTIQTF